MQHFTTVAAALALAGYAVALPSYVAEELEKRQEDHHYDPAPANAGMSRLAGCYPPDSLSSSRARLTCLKSARLVLV